MLDDTLGPALVATLGPGQFAPTTDLHVQFLRPRVRDGSPGAAESSAGAKDIAFMAGELFDDSGQVVAAATATAVIRAA
jgi:acyl-coenzyme A thioesterase PaaI-like protein